MIPDRFPGFIVLRTASKRIKFLFFKLFENILYKSLRINIITAMTIKPAAIITQAIIAFVIGFQPNIYRSDIIPTPSNSIWRSISYREYI